MFAPQTFRPPTSADVARAAGVSRATVSFVLNDHPQARISQATRDRVLQVARDLGYTPSVTAQTLRAGTQRGLLVPLRASGDFDLYDRAIPRVLAHAAARNIEVDMLVSTQCDPSAAAREWAGRRPRAVIAPAEICTEEATETLRRAGVQALVVVGPRPVDYAPCLVLHDEEFGERAVAYLRGRGHEHLAYLGPGPASATPAQGRREAAVRLAAAASGCEVERIEATRDPASLRDWASAWRDLLPRPTAVVACDDPHALAALRAFADAGIDVPGEIAVVGAGNHSAGPLLKPSLTTLEWDLEALVAGLLDAVGTLLDGAKVERVDPPPVRVVVRESA